MLISRATGPGRVLRCGNSAAKFAHIDGYINERLAALASAQHGPTGRNWGTRFNHECATEQRVPRPTGTVKPTTAYASAHRCRRAACGRAARTV